MKKFLALLFLLGGCQTAPAGDYNHQLAAWLGHTQWSLFHKWGEPDRQIALDSDTYVVVYLKEAKLPFHGIKEPYCHTISCKAIEGPKYGYSQLETVYYCQTFFTLRNNIVVDYSFNGDDCI